MRTPIAFALCLLLLPATASAGVELTLLAGYRGGDLTFPIEARIDPRSLVIIDCITIPCLIADASTDDGDLLPTLILDVPISPAFMVEALLTRQDGDLRLGHFFGSEILFARETYESTTALVGLQRQWGERRVRPFASGGLGLTRFESSAVAYKRPIMEGDSPVRVDEEVLASSLAGGVKIDLASRLALRLEGRSYWHNLSERLGGTLQQLEASLGLTYRW